MIRDIRKVYNKYKFYDYIDQDFSNYHIKSPEEFDVLYGGICWDFVVSLATDLLTEDIYCECYFSEVQKCNKTFGTHTYIIVDNKYWIECSWQKFKGIHIIESLKNIENLLLDYYNGDKIHTVRYDPIKSIGLTAEQFFEFLTKSGVDVYESVC